METDGYVPKNGSLSHYIHLYWPWPEPHIQQRPPRDLPDHILTETQLSNQVTAIE